MKFPTVTPDVCAAVARKIFSKETAMDDCTPIWLVALNNAPIEVIHLLLDSDTAKKTILAKNGYGQLFIHSACLNNGPVEVIQLLLAASQYL